MNNKVVAMKENKLGFKGWLISLELLGIHNHFLTHVILDKIQLAQKIIPRLKKEQVLALLQQAKSHEGEVVKIFKNLNKFFKNDKEIVLTALSKVSDLYSIEEIMGLAGEDVRKNKDIMKVVLNKVSGLANIK